MILQRALAVAMHIQQLGPYTIGRKLGRGGMGTVYEGTHRDTGELVAVKVLSASMSHDEGFRERFESEIKTLKILRHPNIVRLLAHGEQLGMLFYVMELVVGSSLEDELQASRRFQWREVSQIGIQMSRALKHAHDHGVIHRDIKPANLLMAATGETKLSDFGIAKLFGASGQTAAGGVLGTAEYMAPEQTDGRPVTHRSDLYSLGGVLYSLLAGRPPFRASSIPEMLQKQRFAEPDYVRRYCHDCPDELAAIIMQLLEKDPEKRIHNAMILGRRLEAMEHGLSVRKGDEGPQWQHTIAEAESPIPLADDSPLPTDRGAFAAMSGTDGYAPTRPGSDVDNVDNLRDVPLLAGSGGDLSETQYTNMDGKSDPSAYPVAELPATEPPKSRFTTVDDDEREPSGFRETLAVLVAPQTWLLLTALLCVGLIVWYFMQPKSADALYNYVVQLAEDERLPEAESSIGQFLEYHPDDARRHEMEEYLDEIDRMRLERQLDRKTNKQFRTDRLSPIERAYTEAMQQARLNPEQGVAQLEALLALYADPVEGSPVAVSGDKAAARRKADPDALVLKLARSQLDKLKRLAQTYAEDDRALLAIQLKKADNVADESPEKARAMWQGIVQLYADKPWANAAVEQARARLATQMAAKTPRASQGTE